MTVSEPEGAAGGEAEAELSEEEEEEPRVFQFKALSDSESEQGSNVAVQNRSKLLDFLQSDENPRAPSSLDGDFYESLQDLKKKNRRYLQELGLMYQVKLVNNHKSPKENKELEDFFQDDGELLLSSKFLQDLISGNIRRFKSLTDLTGDRSEDEHNPSLPQSCSEPKSASTTWISSVTVPQPFKMTVREARKKSELLKSHAWLELETAVNKKQSQEEAECQKQFRAQPVPAHVFLPLYQEIMEKNYIRRQLETQKRRELLLSMQKPFTFQEKEEKRKKAIRQKILNILVPSKKAATKVRKKIPKSTFEPMLGDKLKEAEILRKIRIEMRAKDLLESSWAPIMLGNKSRENEPQITSRNREQKLSFLQGNFSFKPKINTSVPDFERLYWAFQRKACRQEIKEATHNKPFHLRTSNLRCKHQEMTAFQESSKTPVQKSRSMTCLSSLSANTLPVYITDAVRKRESAIKLLQEDKYKNNEDVRWAELQRKKCKAMCKSLNSRAKAMDPHKSLEETFKDKLKQNWQNDQRRTREYKKELEEMELRVKNRPYLFEQVTKHCAQQGAERHFQDTLKQFGLDEEFIKNKGGKASNPVKKGQSALLSVNQGWENYGPQHQIIWLPLTPEVEAFTTAINAPVAVIYAFMTATDTFYNRENHQSGPLNFLRECGSAPDLKRTHTIQRDTDIVKELSEEGQRRLELT